MTHAAPGPGARFLDDFPRKGLNGVRKPQASNVIF